MEQQLRPAPTPAANTAQVYQPQDVQARPSPGLAHHGSGGFEPDSGGARSGGGDSGGRSGNDELTEVRSGA